MGGRFKVYVDELERKEEEIKEGKSKGRGKRGCMWVSLIRKPGDEWVKGIGEATLCICIYVCM